MSDDDRWPKPLDEPAYYGPLGDIVIALAPQTEADPAAILVQLVVMFGNCIGRTPHFRVGADVHHLNLFAAIVGRTSRGRKGMSRGQAQQVFNDIEADWARTCISSGLSSGEGLIWAVRDEITKQQPIKVKGRVVDYDTVIEDPGIADKRLMVIETELAGTLKVMRRDGSTLSPVIRLAWDGRDLRIMTKTSPAKSTDPHISIIGHVTADELRRDLDATETANGFGNRFLWVLVKRSRELPHGGAAVSLDAITPVLRDAIAAARRSPELRRDTDADRVWERIYSRLSAGRPGMLGAMTARAEAQTMRLACLYALADESSIVRVPHLRAALELWRYCFASAAWLFGDRLGDPVADPILAQLRRVWPERMTRTEISQIFNRNQSAAALSRALSLLQECHLAEVESERDGNGRPTEWWRYVPDSESSLSDEINELNELSPEPEGVISFNSFNSSPKQAAR